jgi:hypothetical protein
MITDNDVTPEKKTRKVVKKRKPRKVVQRKPVTEAKIVGTQKASSEVVLQETTIIETKPAEEIKPVKSRERKERVPFGMARLKLTAPERPGYRRRWVNDVGGALEQAEAGWYGFVFDTGQQIGETAIGSGNQDLGSRVSRIVGTLPNGQPQRAYLMEIEEVYYQQDQKSKQQRLDKIDAQIREGTINPDNDNDMKRYIPSEGISVK